MALQLCRKRVPGSLAEVCQARVAAGVARTMMIAPTTSALTNARKVTTTVFPLRTTASARARTRAGVREGERQQRGPAHAVPPRIGPVAPRHEETDLLAGQAGRLERARQAAPVHDDDPVRQGHHLVQLRGDQQHGRSRVPRRDEPAVHVFDGADIQPAGRLRRR